MSERLIGHILKELRTERGLTPEQLGAIADVSSSFIRKLEKGLRTDMTLEMARKLSAALGVSPTVFCEADLPSQYRPCSAPTTYNHSVSEMQEWAANIQTGLAALADQRERFRLFADFTLEGIAIHDEAGRVLQIPVPRSMEQLLR